MTTTSVFDQSALLLAYAPSGYGKTTDLVLSFPKFLFIAQPGGLLPAETVAGYRPNQIRTARTFDDLIAIVEQEKKKQAKTPDVKLWDGIVIDDWSLMSDTSLAEFEKNYPVTKSGTKDTNAFWGKVRAKLLEVRDCLRYSDFHMVCNCFQGDTKVMTRAGYRAIRDLHGAVEILTMTSRTETSPRSHKWKYGLEGTWRTAQFKSYGVQALHRVEFTDGSSALATGDHVWYVTERRAPVATQDLVGYTVPIVLPPKPPTDDDYERGVLHGFVFGDGSKGTKGTAYVPTFTEAKTKAMQTRFDAAGFRVRLAHAAKDHLTVGLARFAGMPRAWKDLPSAEVPLAYWYGFIVGLLAADGTVDDRGGVILFQSNKEALETIRLKALECGFSCLPLRLYEGTTNFGGGPNWRLWFRRFSVQADELLLEHHKSNFINAGPAKQEALGVKSVERLTLLEEVFCCVEPKTHTMVIEGNILTGQCHERGPHTDERKGYVPGGPALPGTMPADMPKTFDAVLRVAPVDGVPVWPFAYRADENDTSWVTKNRFALYGDLPMNLGEMLRMFYGTEGKWGIRRHESMPWQEEMVEKSARLLGPMELASEEHLAMRQSIANSLRKKIPGVTDMQIAWTLRDGMHRAIFRALRQRGILSRYGVE